jgi:hypothetical protein
MKVRLLVLVALWVAPGVVHAADDAAVTALASALAIPALERVGRVAIVAAGPDSPDAARFRTVVATAFARAGHATVWGQEPLVGAEPERASLMKYWTEQHASGVAVVRFSTPFEQARGSVVLYDVAGTPLFRAFANRADATWTAWPLLDPRKFPGTALYEEIGRQDLVDRYRRRSAGKVLVQVAGGLAVTAGMGMILVSALATIDSDSKSTITLTERALITGGTVMLIAPFFISSDPLNADEREQLVGGGRDALSVAAAPLPGGGSLAIAGRF